MEKPDFNKNPFTSGNGATSDKERKVSNGHDHVSAEAMQRFRFQAFRHIELDTAPAYIVHEILPRLGIVLVWGKPKSGKTFWTFDIEMHVALGWPYRERRVEQGMVLHIACEGVAGLGARKEAWRLFHEGGHPAEELDDAPFYLCKQTTLDLINDAPTVIAAIRAQFPGQQIRIIAIDTLNRSLRGSESRDEDMSAYLRAAISLAEEFKCMIVIVHHCGYDQSHPRGHTSLIGSVDADIEVKKDDTGIVCTEVQNMRDGATGAKTFSKLRPVKVGLDDNGTPITSCAVEPAEPQPQPRPVKKLTGAAKVAFDQLSNCLVDHAQEIPPSRHVPTGVQGVTLELWRGYLENAGIVNRKGSPREQFRRVRVTLQDLGFIGVWGDFVWASHRVT